MSAEICVLLEDLNLREWGGGGGVVLNIHKSKIKYQAAKLLSFAS